MDFFLQLLMILLQYLVNEGVRVYLVCVLCMSAFK